MRALINSEVRIDMNLTLDELTLFPQAHGPDDVSVSN